MSYDHDKSSRQQRMALSTSQDTETEGEKQFKRLLEKQLKKNFTLDELTRQKRVFNKSSTFKASTEDVVGQVSLNRFKEIEDEKSYLEHLQQIGLNRYEINQWIKRENVDKQQSETTNKTITTDPQILRKQIEEIKNKIQIKNDEINKAVQTRDVLSLSRHEMEIESSLRRTNKRSQFLRNLVQIGKSSTDDLHPDDPTNHLKEMENELFGKFKTKKRKIDSSEKLPSRDFEESAISTCARRPITDEEILNNRLTVDEIRAIPKFTNYNCGDINRVLYVKNLSGRTIQDDLINIFSRFGKVDVRVLTGKMHGQSFVTFPDSESATKALETVNGFILYGKPLVVYYKKI